MASPALVDHLGRPIDFGVLKRNQAAPSTLAVRSIVGGHPADGLTPSRLGRILRAAEIGDAESYLELAEQMEEKYLHYLSVLGTRKRAVSQLEITVDAASADKADVKIADYVREWASRDELELELFNMLDAVGKGFSATKIHWETTKTDWLPKRLEWIDPRWIQFDRNDGRTPLIVGDSGQLEQLDPGGWIFHTHGAKSGIPIRGGLARPVAWAYLFQNFSLKDWVAFAEVYGLPLRLGKYDNGETDENIRILMRAVAGISSDAAAVIPKSMDLEFVDGKAANGGGDLFERLCEYLDKQVSKAVVGQTATTDAETGGLGSGKEHGDVREDIRDADAKQVAGTLNRDLIRLMVDFKFGPQDAYPRLRLGRSESIDIDKESNALARLIPLGLKVKASQVRDKFGYEDPADDDEVLGKAVAAAPSPGGSGDPAPTDAPENALPDLLGPLKALRGAPKDTASAAPGSPAPSPDAIDLGIDAALSDWAQVVDAIVSPVEQVLAQAHSLEEARDILASVIDAMDVSQLSELLTRTSFSARLAGLSGAPLTGDGA